MQHQPSIQNEDRIVTATGDGRVPFVAASDIAAVGFHALTDEVPHNTDHLILGPELLSYNDVRLILHLQPLHSRPYVYSSVIRS